MSDLSDNENLLVELALSKSDEARQLGESAVQAIVVYYVRDLGRLLEFDSTWFEGWTLYDSVEDACEENGINTEKIRQDCFERSLWSDNIPSNAEIKLRTSRVLESKLFEICCVLYVGDWLDESVLVRPRGNDEESEDYILYDGEFFQLEDGKGSLHGRLDELLKLGADDKIMFVINNMDEKFGSINAVTSAKYCFGNKKELITLYIKRSGGEWQYVCEPMSSKDFDPHEPQDDMQEIFDLVYDWKGVRYRTLVKSEFEDLGPISSRWEVLD